MSVMAAGQSSLVRAGGEGGKRAHLYSRRLSMKRWTLVDALYKLFIRVNAVAVIEPCYLSGLRQCP